MGTAAGYLKVTGQEERGASDPTYSWKTPTNVDDPPTDAEADSPENVDGETFYSLTFTHTIRIPANATVTLATCIARARVTLDDTDVEFSVRFGNVSLGLCNLIFDPSYIGNAPLANVTTDDGSAGRLAQATPARINAGVGYVDDTTIDGTDGVLSIAWLRVVIDFTVPTASLLARNSARSCSRSCSRPVTARR